MGNKFTPTGSPESGNLGGQDPTEVSAQYPSSLFGVAIPQGTGAPGSTAPGGQALGSNDVSMPNQYPSREAISGVALDGTGAPGSEGVSPDDGGVAITVTNPNNYQGTPGGGSGTQMVTVTDSISGPQDSTAPPGNYPPSHQIIPGPLPMGTGAGEGRLTGGRYTKGVH